MAERIDLTDSATIDKFKAAADITNQTLIDVLQLVKAEASVASICAAGDQMLLQRLSNVFAKIKFKGIAFPTCVSVNNIICHFAPLLSDKQDIILKEGDLVKVALGSHIDGLPTLVAHTVTVGQPTKDQERLLAATFFAAEAAWRMLRPDYSNFDLAEMVDVIAREFGCIPCQGMMSTELAKNIFEGEKKIVLTRERPKDYLKHHFELGQVWMLDIILVEGAVSKPTKADARGTVFKREDKVTYSLKMAASRKIFSEIRNKFASMPFHLRQFENENLAKMGLQECAQHGLVTTFDVFEEEKHRVVSEITFTVLLMPNGNITRLTTGPPISKDGYSVTNEAAQKILALPVNKKKN